MKQIVDLPDDYPEVEHVREAGMALANGYARMGNYTYGETYTRLAAKRPREQ